MGDYFEENHLLAEVDRAKFCNFCWAIAVISSEITFAMPELFEISEGLFN